MKIKKSITFKMFIITFIFFIFFISCILGFQSFFFQNFYISKKTSDFKSNFEKFQVNYNSSKNDNDIISYARDFEDNNNSKIAVIDRKGNLEFLTGSGNGVAESANVRIIREVINNWAINPNSFTNIQNSGGSTTYTLTNRAYNIKNLVCVLVNKSTGEVLFAVTSLQPVNEAEAVMKEFYIYIYIAVILLILILSIIYSNMITKPLIKLNMNASKMANLDFSEEYVVTSEDEIGNLGKTLNFLSYNLNGAMNSLKKANVKLKEDIEKERELEKMRKEFVGGVSHELKTPISLIKGYAEGIKDNVFVEEDKDYYIDVIIDEANKMGNLVSDMLDLSQLESGNFKLIKDNFYLDKLVNSTFKKYYNVFNEKDIEVNIELINNVLVYGDKTRIEQVLTNFINNAIRHSGNKGEINIIMNEKNDKVYVYIKNSGDNIPTNELPKIWSKFYKIDKSRNRALGGTGLGLAIVKNILLLHKSDFGVENYEGGVSFYFSLKRVYNDLQIE